jgi:WD40 repeat protein
VAAVAFSPDDTKLATGSWDQQVRVYDATAAYKLLWTFSGNSTSVEHVQWSADSDILMSNSKDCQMLYWEVATGARVNKTSLLRDVEWAQWKAVLGWPVMGIWDPGYDQTDVNAVCQSNKGDLIVIGDDYGQLKLLQYPSPTTNAAGACAYPGHSSHVTNARWLHDDSLVVTTGGHDTGVFQWRFQEGVTPLASNTIMPEVKAAGAKTIPQMRSKSPKKRPAGEAQARVVAGGGGITAVQRPIGRAKLGLKPAKVTSPAFLAKYGGSASAEAQPPVRVQLARSVSSLFLPTGLVESREHAEPPNDSLELEYVYGYNGRDGKANAHLNAEGRVVYHTAAVGITLDPENKTQGFFQGHNDDIVCLAMAPNRKIIASGQVNPSGGAVLPYVCVWDSTSNLQVPQRTQPPASPSAFLSPPPPPVRSSKLAALWQVAKLEMYHTRAIPACAFSANGRQLITIGNDDDHWMAVWDLQKACPTVLIPSAPLHYWQPMSVPPWSA